jgi:hypothetical protein
MDEGRQSGWPFKILTNIGLSLRAAGPAAVVVTWIICVTLLGLFGSGDLAKTAIGILSVLGGVLGAAFAANPDRWDPRGPKR